MVKVLVKETSPKAVQTALVSGLKREIRQLNAEDYNYGDIMANISLLQTYAKLVGQRLNMNIELDVDIEHTSKGKLNLINTSSLSLKDINAAFKQNYNLLTEFLSQISAIYGNLYDKYLSTSINTSLLLDEFEMKRDKYERDIESLKESLNKSDLITKEDIEKAIQEAKERTEQDIKEKDENADKIAKDVWSKNKGYETASDAQAKGKEAAEKYAKDKEIENKIRDIDTKLEKDTVRLSEVENRLDSLNSELDKNKTDVEKAKDDYTESLKLAESDIAKQTGVINIVRENPTATKVGDIKNGTYIGKDSSGKDVISNVTDLPNGGKRIETEYYNSIDKEKKTTVQEYNNQYSIQNVADYLNNNSAASQKDAEKKADIYKDELKKKTEIKKQINQQESLKDSINKEIEKGKTEKDKLNNDKNDVHDNLDDREHSSDGGKAKEQADKSMEENRGKNGMPSNL